MNAPNVKAISKILDRIEGKREWKIIPELQELLRPMSNEERKELEQSISEEGIREPILIWKEQEAIIDGHNRYQIGTKIGKDVPFIERSFPDINAVKKWMIRNQLGRRNLTKDEFTYLLGAYYNTVKQDTNEAKTPNPDNKTTAEIVGDQFGVHEKTVRRAAEVAKGVDKLAQVKGTIAKIQQLSGKGDYNNEELSEIGKASSSTVAAKALEKLDASKALEKQQKAAVKQKAAAVAKAAAAAPKTYPVALCEPKFDTAFNPATVDKPPLGKEAVVYFIVPDEHLMDGMDLIRKWGLQYECSFIFNGSDTYEGTFSKIGHTFMLVASKGVVAGPKKGDEQPSVLTVKGDPFPAMVKIVDKYHPKDMKLDFRPKGSTPNGWARIAK